MLPEETRARAVVLVAQGAKTADAIADELGIGHSTIRNWKADPEFRNQVRAFRQRVYDEVIEGGIGDLKMRVIAKNDRWLRALKVIERRAADPEIAAVPGGDTGLVVRRETTIHTGKDEYRVVIEHEFDTGLWNALLNMEKDAAIELGQYKQKIEHKHGLDDETRRALALFTPEEREMARQIILERTQTAAAE